MGFFLSHYVNSSHRTVDLGPASDLGSLPRELEVNGRRFFLVEPESGDLRLLSRVCPHMGGHVEDRGDRFECPVHGWQFDREDGSCINVEGESMNRFEVRRENGRVRAEIPLDLLRKSSDQIERSAEADFQLNLHAHACLEIERGDFSLLTDPWLSGPAFYGAWIQYPPPLVQPEQLRPDAILITHEHSDHFHEPTLRRMNRDVPIYVPKYPNGRLERRLDALGFSDVRGLDFGETAELAENLALTCFEPESPWNDAIAHVEIGDFSLLNLNDAGLNQRIAARVAPVDLLASAFSWGASGYPMTWTHLEPEEQRSICRKASSGMLQMLEAAAEQYRAARILPFAGHFSLWHPAHRAFAERMEKNTVADVVRHFREADAEVIDLLPGETWDSERGETDRVWSRREKMFETDYKMGYLDAQFEEEVFRTHHPTDLTLDPVELDGYLERLSESPEIGRCEEMTVEIVATSGPTCEDDPSLRRRFALEPGDLELRPGDEESPDLQMRVPGSLLADLIRNDVSWDEAHIGYWCRFLPRAETSEEADFWSFMSLWRLLQAPYYNRASSRMPEPRSGDRARPITRDAVIADVLERYGDPAGRILRRHGLYCWGCQHAPAETIAEGARVHGLTDDDLDDLLDELNRALPFEIRRPGLPRRAA